MVVERATVALSPPHRLVGKVVEGFKRGSKELGWPTANLDPRAFETRLDKETEGVYVGWAKISGQPMQSSGMYVSSMWACMYVRLQYVHVGACT